MGATTRLGLSFPDDGDAPDVPGDIQTLAQDVEDKVALPAGTLLATAAAAAPSGYLLCDGASKVRADYADLFAAIGTTYGSADGTHFNVPDLRGRVPVGVDGAGARLTANDALGQHAGEEKHQLTETELAGHRHKQRGNGGGGSTDFAYHDAIHQQTGGEVPVAEQTDSTGNDVPHNNMQPYLIVNYMIKT